ncbi:MAG: hypothetical protein V1743_00870 [Nanoarchaeota archaeon]
MRFRPSTLEERKQFYEKEFPLQKARSWFRKIPQPQICAVDAGSDTGIIADRKLRGLLLYFPFAELQKKIRQYIPEDIYYDRNRYEDPEKVLKTLKFDDHISQELVFDLDADNIHCAHPKSQQVCPVCLKKAYQKTVAMKKELEKEFRSIEVVYTGKGFHLHVLDKKAFFLTIHEREQLNKRFSKYPIDPWVSRGYIRLIRMPYTLNALVSRKAIPVDTGKGFNPKEAIPGFLKR